MITFLIHSQRFEGSREIRSYIMIAQEKFVPGNPDFNKNHIINPLDLRPSIDSCEANNSRASSDDESPELISPLIVRTVRDVLSSYF